MVFLFQIGQSPGVDDAVATRRLALQQTSQQHDLLAANMKRTEFVGRRGDPHVLEGLGIAYSDASKNSAESIERLSKIPSLEREAVIRNLDLNLRIARAAVSAKRDIVEAEGVQMPFGAASTQESGQAKPRIPGSYFFASNMDADWMVLLPLQASRVSSKGTEDLFSPPAPGQTKLYSKDLGKIPIKVKDVEFLLESNEEMGKANVEIGDFEKILRLLGTSVVYSAFDYFGYNLTKDSKGALIAYRVVQEMAKIGATYYLYEKDGLGSAISFNLMAATFFDDFVYYGIGELLDPGHGFQGKGALASADKGGIAHAWWTPVGLARGGRGSKVPLDTLIAQAGVGLVASFVLTVNF